MKNYKKFLVFRVILILSVAVLLSACSSEAPSGDNPATSSPSGIGASFGTIVAVGDSLTAGYGVEESQAYPALLQQRLLLEGHFYRVVNAGVSGETSSGTQSRIAWVIASLDPDIIILETGANDGLRGVDPMVLEKNLDQIVTTIKAAGIAVILAGMKLPPNLGSNYTMRFSKVYPRIADKYAISLIPFFLKRVAGDVRYNLPDRTHPNPEGYRRIVDDIYPYVVDVIKQNR